MSCGIATVVQLGRLLDRERQLLVLRRTLPLVTECSVMQRHAVAAERHAVAATEQQLSGTQLPAATERHAVAVKRYAVAANN